ncbi:YhgE/Pip domain-containing protein [Spelaeicoccus albus]|uniref:Putative membrane protein n=1 Tax=Spelaeicoccus albus TaxID=1280376 RepID=A0A7Z0D4G2_9MICO|nr:YhgE/Pip domain-containing protein [Spelaeicoccus albus]NYI68699.1 putative membrane protein [Spelaeicoccus albus]
MFSLSWLELSRFKRTSLTKAAVAAILIVPTIYGGLYLSANWKPTEHLGRLHAAVVNEDRGAVQPQSSERLTAGDDLVDSVTAKGAAGFDWTATSAEKAKAGLKDGSYYAVLTIPPGFSSSLVSTGGKDPHRAKLSFTTNDSNNFVVGQLSSTVLSGIRTSLDHTTTANYLSKMYVGFNDIHAQTSKAASGAHRLNSGSSDLRDATGSLVTGLTKLDTASGKLADGADDVNDGARSAASNSATLADGAGQVAEGTSRLAAGADSATSRVEQVRAKAATLADSARTTARQAKSDFDKTGTTIRQSSRSEISALQKKYPHDPDIVRLAKTLNTAESRLDDASARAAQHESRAARIDQQLRERANSAVATARTVDRKVNSLNDGARKVSSGAARLHTGLTTLSTGAARLAGGANQLHAGVGKSVRGARKIDNGSDKLYSGIVDLSAGLDKGVKQIPTYSKSDRATRSDVAASPVNATQTTLNAVDHYGEGLAPFFVPLALWIGGMVTFMLLKAVPVRALASTVRSWRIMLAGWLPGAALGVVQALVLFGVLFLFVGLSAPSIPAVLGFGVLVAVCFAAVHQALVALFGAIGRLLGLILLVLQLTSAGGTYPVATSPGFFQAISPFMPMTYAVRGLRILTAGGDGAIVGGCVLVLVVTTCLALLATIAASHRGRMWTVGKLHPSLSL